ncbi:MAG: hypothetical protein IKG66_07635, partial [Lachnospiraceae bacterium]|nr:hypothetical protein [Lachnospiraceae bacterium]
MDDLHTSADKLHTSADDLTQRAVRYITDLFSGNAGGHDAAHTMRVYRNALWILEDESEADREVVLL